MGLNEQQCRATARNGRMTKWKGQVASIAPSVFLGSVSAIALSVGGVNADTINTAQTTPFVSAVDTDHTITANGSVIVNPLNSTGVVEINVADYTSTLTNAGTVATSSGSSAPHVGIDINGDLSGTVSNTGAVNLNYTGVSDADLTGVDISGTTTGTISNNGLINVQISATSSATARGIVTNGLLSSGQIVNRGSISVNAQGSRASASGISSGSIATSGSLINTGSVKVVANASSSSVRATGFTVGTLEGIVKNTGTIDVQVSGRSGATGRGIQTMTVHGTLINSGQITADVNGRNSFAQATGVDTVTVGPTGQVINSGSLLVNALGSTIAHAKGISIDSGFSAVQGLVRNSGTISARANATSGDASATGLRTSNIATDASVINSGSITAVAYGITSANAYALDADNLAGTLLNSGTLRATAIGREATASGLNGNIIEATGTLINSGNISAVARSTSSANAFGLNVQRINGQVVNSGTITAISDGGSTAIAEGLVTLFIFGGGSTTNSGTINVSATANGGPGAFANGLVVFSAFGGAIVNNTGTINVTAASNGSTISAVGISTDELSTGAQLFNSGTINVLARSTAGSPTTNSAYGIRARTLDGAVTHSGSISVRAEGKSARAYGIFADTHNGTLNVSGDISVSGSGTNYGIFLGRGTGTLNIDSSASIDQKIRVADHDVNLNHVGSSAVYRFEDANTAAGTFTTTVSAPNGAWFSQGEGGSTPIYAAVSGSDFQINTAETFQILGLNSSLSSELGNSGANTVSQNAISYDNDRANIWDGFNPYWRVTVGRAEQDASATQSSVDSTLGSVSAGLTKDVGAGLRYGFGANYIIGNSSVGQNELDSRGVYVSGIIAKDFGFADLSFGVGAGYLDHDSSRVIVGSADAEASYSSSLLTAQVGASKDFGLENGMTVTPEAMFQYGHQNVDGYTETGSLANATVSSQDFDFTQTRVGASLSKPVSNGTLTASLAAIYRDVNGPSALGVSVFGSSATLVAAAPEAETLGELGLGYTQSWGEGHDLRVQALANFGSDSNAQSFSALYQWNF